ncbi:MULTISPECIES: AI-2E family transporter [Desulfosediminicola]|uniref:AI-2E family transporter n=1 Tax=Desulfosediminicola TaxID=2886823 RepID=UPI0010ABEBE2|nr:AI-2E family transporter [Desulfosediminicola ganghwensis]
MDTRETQQYNLEKVFVEAAIRIALIAILAFATVRIVTPFIMPFLWGVIIAVAVAPLIEKLSAKAAGKRKFYATFFALTVITALVVPTVMLVAESVESVQTFSEQLEEGNLHIPAPPENIRQWPIIGEPSYSAWKLASTNLESALKRFKPQVRSFATFLLAKAGSGIQGLLMFILSIAISAVLLATAPKGAVVMNKVANRFLGNKAKEMVPLATATIRGVMQGVIGVAIIQATLAAIGMVAAGVPAAGFWALGVLILAVIQLPAVLILGPIAAWVFTFTSTVPAVVFLIWALLVSGCDSLLKPILMGRGVNAPMIVILIGALGGMISSGIIGLFVGAVIVAISYTLFIAWVNDYDENKSPKDKNEPQPDKVQK